MTLFSILALALFMSKATNAVLGVAFLLVLVVYISRRSRNRRARGATRDRAA